MSSRSLIGRSAAGVLGLATLLVVAAPAGATHGGNHPTFRTVQTYFHCAGAIKVQNIGLITDGPSSWNTTAPGSATGGNGCGALDPGALRGGNQGTIYDAVFAGTFTGNLRDMTLELHNLLLSRVRAGETFTVRVRMSIDGEPVFPETAGVSVAVTPVLSSTGASEKMLISITGLGCATEVKDANGNVVNVIAKGLATEDGDGELERTITLAIDSNFADRAGAWVWDASEVPSGITFNPGTLAAARVAASNAVSC